MNRVIKIISLVIISSSIFLAGCASDNVGSSKGLSKITQTEAKNIMDNEKGIVILDVRTKSEYDEGHIKDSLLIPLDNIEKGALEKIKDKDTKILVYCRSGNRSKQAGKKLVEMGYTNVYDFGGINTWDYEIEK